ncbi:MAG: DUF4349 domain-containing protein [Dehalococcoidales bacterium]
MNIKRLIIGLLVVLLLLVAVSCARDEADTLTPSTAETGLVAPGLDETVSEEAGALLLVAEERMIVRTGDMSLVIEDVTTARDEITQMATRFDGYVVSSQISGEEEEMRGWISIRVPDEEFELALAELRDLAVRVKQESTSSRDVTEEYTDLESRLKNAEATESQYLALLEKAIDVEDILKIYDSLSRVRGEIEQIKGRMQYLERTSQMSLITVYLEPVVSAKPLVSVGWSALEVLKSAVRGIVTLGQWLANGAIWLLIFSPIWGTALGIIIWRRRKAG